MNLERVSKIPTVVEPSEYISYKEALVLYPKRMPLLNALFSFLELTDKESAWWFNHHLEQFVPLISGANLRS